MAKRFPNTMKVDVLQRHIDAAECRLPLRCMHKLAITEAILAVAGADTDVRVKVDGSGIAVRRRKDYRERAFLPPQAIKSMLAFDRGEPIKPHSYTIKFVKTARIAKTSEEAKAKNLAAVKKNRAKRISEGIPEPKRKIRSIGLSA